MVKHNWKTAQRRPHSKNYSLQSLREQNNKPCITIQTGAGLNSIKEVSVEKSGDSSISRGESGGHSSDTSKKSSNEEHRGTSNMSVTSESIDNVFQMLEDEHAKYSHQEGNDKSPVQRDMDLDKEIQKEIGDIDLGSSGSGRSGQQNSPPQQAFMHGSGHDDHHHHHAAPPIAQHPNDSPSQQSDDESEEGGPVIYTNHDDDDDFSQITSSIAGNTLYSHEYMFSSISFPNKNKSNLNHRNLSGAQPSNVPSLDGTDSGGSSRKSGGSGGSGSSPLPSMDEKKSLVMDNDDFERFFGNSSNGATHRKNGNTTLNRSGDPNDGPINLYNNPHIHSHNHISGHKSALDDQNDDDMTIGDVYSYAPSTMGESTMNSINSSNPLIWLYKQAYNLFNGGQWTDINRKKNDDLDSIDDDADYFGTMMSADFLSSSPQNLPWNQANKQKKALRTACIFGGLFFFGILVYSGGDIGTEVVDAFHTPPTERKTEMKTTTEIKEVRQKSNLRPSKNLKKIDMSHEGMQLPSIFDKSFADVTDSSSNTIPFFWHIPRSAGATMNDIFSACHHFRVATNIGIGGGHDHDAKLQVVNYDDKQFVNVDISTDEGIQRAVKMGFASSDLTDVAISSLLHESAALFSPSKKAKMFTLFRHPVDRIVSMFYFMQDTVWKADTTSNKDLANISIETFFSKQLGETNWHVRFLTNQLTKAYVDEEDFKLAKEILRRKALVGLMSEKEESFDRFSKYFGWKPKNDQDLECQKRRLQWEWSLRNPHEVEIVEGNRLWNLISGQNSYDMRLYEYAQYLYEEQAKYF